MIKKLFDFLWRVKFNIALFISILIVVVLSFYIFLALSNFYKYKTIVDPKLELTLDRFHFFFKNELKKEWIRVTAPKPLSDDESPLKTFRITVKQKDLDSLNADLPTSGKDHYVDALMKASDSEKLYKVKLRYRGDNNYHWLYKQKSLKIKLNKNDLYNMENKFSIINGPMLSTYIDYSYQKIAQSLGLISLEYNPVRLFINGKYYGVYVYLTNIDESLLRKHKLMPGSIYSGDESKIQNGIPLLWFDSIYWKKVAARNSEQKNNRDDIKLIITSINDLDDNQFHSFVNTYIDKDKVFKYIAIDRLFGAAHHDFHHNHKIYFDPYKGKFQLIPWDTRWISGSIDKDTSIYALNLRLKLDPVFDYEIDKIVYNLLENGFYKNFLKLTDNIVKQTENDLISDAYKDTAIWRNKLFNKTTNPWYSEPFSFNDLLLDKKDAKRILNVRKKILLNILNNTQISYMYYDKNLYLQIVGNTPVVLKNIDNTFTLYTKKGISRKKQIRYFVSSPNSFTYLPVVYNIGKINIKTLEFKNAITKKNIVIKNKKFDISDNIILSLKKTKSKSSKYVFKGIVMINKTKIIKTPALIHPGTTFIMDANTSIYFYGKVTALGTKENPIRFIAKDPKKPWGLVAVQGKATTGSRFEYVEFENGSVDTHNLIHYTSPFNIHDMDWFEVRHCKIGRNFVGDDSMHIAYAKGIVDSCEFVDARSDGLDIDISDVNITNNIFYNSGNDGLDIMTTTMNASNNVFIDMGDKGISVGEWSDANISDSIFIRTVIGTEVKDKSKVKAQNLVFVDSKEKAINLYNKNKRYDTGGFLTGEYIYLLGNTKVKADKRSSKKITQKFEGVLPKLQKYQWYETIENTPYKKYMDEVEVKYAQ